MYNHNKAQQSKNRVHICWDILYREDISYSNIPYIFIMYIYNCVDVSMKAVKYVLGPI